MYRCNLCGQVFLPGSVHWCYGISGWGYPKEDSIVSRPTESLIEQKLDKIIKMLEKFNKKGVNK